MAAADDAERLRFADEQVRPMAAHGGGVVRTNPVGGK
jgi:hypothetical protein